MPASYFREFVGCFVDLDVETRWLEQSESKRKAADAAASYCDADSLAGGLGRGC